MVLYKERTIFQLLLLYSVLCPLIVVPIFGVNLGFADLIFPVSCIFVLLFSKSLKLNLGMLLVSAFLFLCFFSLLLIEDGGARAESFYKVLRLIAICMPLYLVSIINVDLNRLEQSIKYGFFGLFLALHVALIAYYFDFSFSEYQQQLWVGDGNGPINRAAGVLGNTGAFGALIALAMIVNTYLLLNVGRKGTALYLYTYFLGAMLIILSSSRMALISSVIPIAVFLWFGSRLPFYKKVLILAVALFVVAVTFSSVLLLVQGEYANVSLARFGFNGGVENYSSGRLQNWTVLLSIIVDDPILGVGYKHGVSAFGDFIDNNFLSSWYELGIFGVILFVSFFIFWGRQFFAIKGCFKVTFKFIPAIYLALLVSFFLTCLTSDALSFWMTTPVVLLWLGALSTTSESELR